MSGRVVLLLLQYLYTGRCLFPSEDLNLGIELMAAADQFLLEPMRVQCERTLSKKIDAEVCVHLITRFHSPNLVKLGSQNEPKSGSSSDLKQRTSHCH